MPKLQTLNSSINFINEESRSSSVCSHTLDLEPHVHYLELQEKHADERLAAELKRLEDRKFQLPSEEELKTNP
ncbi:hypothetical protein CVS40_8150 [Lucilia cuprina]|nr:hypothetical protein CVS40_8150 [Lucilia cuprina]